MGKIGHDCWSEYGGCSNGREAGRVYRFASLVYRPRPLFACTPSVEFLCGEDTARRE